MPGLSRRDFLSLLLKGLLAYPVFRLGGFPIRLSALNSIGSFPLVSVARGTDIDIPEILLNTALAGIGGLERFVKTGSTVAVKVNTTWAYKPHTASNTDPDLLRAMIRALKNAGAGRIIIMDHCSIDPGAQPCVAISGIGAVVKEEGVEGVFPDRTNAPLSWYTNIELPSGKSFKKISVMKAAVDADVRINMAVAKTHNVTKMTMCLKHMMGLLQSPGRLHTDIEQGIADINTSSPIQPQLHILEAIRVRYPHGSNRFCAGPETDLTHPDVVKRLNQVVVGTDPALIDAYGCITFYQMQPEELTHLARADQTGVGSIDIQAALADGRVQIFAAGQPVAQAQPTAASTPTIPPTQVAKNGPIATAAPLPTQTPVTQAVCPPVDAPAASLPVAGSDVVDAGQVLNTALIPAAVVIAGAGMVALNQANRRQHPSPPDGNDHDGQE